MSFFDDIADGLSTGLDAVTDGVGTVTTGITDTVKSGFDFGKSVLGGTALGTADGANLFVAGWRDVFSAEFQNGLSKMAFGISEAVGILPSSGVKQYEEAIGEASLWTLRESQKKNQRICFSTYWDQVQQNFVRLNLQTNDSVKQKARDGINQMPWIDPDC